MDRSNPSVPLLSRGDDQAGSGYQQDFVLWLTSQAALLRARRYDLLDLDNLSEEIDAMSRREHRELRSRLKVILIHLLKCKCRGEHQSRGWLGTLAEQRDGIAELLKDSPSLRQQVAEYIGDAYPAALSQAALQTGLDKSAFPIANPFSPAEVLDPDFVPGQP